MTAPGMAAPGSVRATAPVRVADVGGWCDTWFGSPGQVCSLAVGPGVEVVAELAESSAEVPAGSVRLVALDVGVDVAFDPAVPPEGLRRAHGLLVHAVGEGLVGADLAGAGLGLRVTVSSAVPPGASLGTSAAVVVAVLGALRGLRTPSGHQHATAADPAELGDLARQAHAVEVGPVGRESGVQDQWAAALGGAGLLAVGPYPDVRHRPLEVPPSARALLGDRLVTVVFGAHDSSQVHAEVINALVGCGGEVHDRARSALRRLSSLAGEAAAALESGDLDAWGRVLTASVAAQAALHPGLIGSAHAVAIEVARTCGAAGWKVNGAGGDGGSLTVLAGPEPGAAQELRAALRSAGPGWVLPDLRPARGLQVERLS